jgi:bis(5'-adenosyl)-triphosphatase
MSSAVLFSTIEVTRQVFYRTSLSYAIVNLKPIVPGRKQSLISHILSPPVEKRSTDVLVIPHRPVPRLSDLTTPELASLMTSVQHVGRVVERVYEGDALTIACQVALITA